MIKRILQKIQVPKIRWSRRVRLATLVFGTSLFVTLFVLGAGYPETTYAFWETILAGIQYIAAFFAWIVFSLAYLVISLTFFAMRFFILLAGYNAFSEAPIVNLGWTLVRDIANMFFIVALLVIAFATILGREDYAMKRTLGKLILMAILINFSKLIAQVFLDAAHVVTMTFINALSAVAGGNLIQIFNLDEMRTLLSQGTGGDRASYGEIGLQLLVASGMTMALAVTAFITVGVYAVIMLYRMVTLFVLIIISPFAYAAAAIPATASFSRDWWGRFSKNVISAPMMAFFLWIAFATMGNGQVLEHIVSNNSIEGVNTQDFLSADSRGLSGEGGLTNDKQQSASLSSATTWANMAGFAVAVAFLFAGIEQVQRLGVEGAGGLSKATDFGKKAFMLTSGVAAGWWATKRVGGAAKDYAMLAGYGVKRGVDKSIIGRAPIIGGIITGRNKARREAALSKAKEYSEMKKERYKTEGGGIAGKMAPSKDTRAEEEIKGTLAKRGKEAEYKKVKDEIVSSEILKEYNVVDERKTRVENALIDKTIGAFTDEDTQAVDSLVAQGVDREEAKREHALGKLDTADFADAYTKGKVFDGLRFASTAALEEAAKQKTGKAEGETKRQGQQVMDILRGWEGKRPDTLENAEIGKISEELKEYAPYSLDQKLTELEENWKAITRLNKKIDSGEDLNDQERKMLKNKTQNQGRLLAAMYNEGTGAVAAKKLASMDASYRNQDINTAEGVHKALLGLTTGRSYTEINSTDGAVKWQEEFRKRMKDKGGIIMRAIQTGMNNAAQNKGQHQFYGQLTEGRTATGQKKIGFLALQRAGIGKEKQLGTGSRSGGVAALTSKINGEFLADYNIDSSDDGRAYMNTQMAADGKTEVTIGVRDEVRDAVLDIVNKSADQIKKMATPKKRFIMGGNYDKSSWDGNNFVVHNDAMRNFVLDIANGFQARINSANAEGNRQAMTRALESMRAFYAEQGIDTQGLDADQLMAIARSVRTR